MIQFFSKTSRAIEDSACLLFWCLPTDVDFPTPPPSASAWELVGNEQLSFAMPETRRTMFAMFIHMDLSDWNRPKVLEQIFTSASEKEKAILRKMMGVAILQLLTLGQSSAEIAHKYGFSGSFIEQLSELAITRAHQTSKFLRSLNRRPSIVFRQIADCLKYRVTLKQLSLLGIPTCKSRPEVARALWQAGIREPDDIEAETTQTISEKLQSTISGMNTLKIVQELQNEVRTLCDHFNEFQ
jgi:hypothetical protein